MKNLHQIKEALKDEKSIKRFRKEMLQQFERTSKRRLRGARHFGKEHHTRKGFA
jgi:hypothetical protein